MVTDVSAVTYFAPIFVFLLVFVVVFAVLARTKILGDEFPRVLLIFIAFVVAALFISFGGVQRYVETLVPWLAVLIVSLFFLLLMAGFAGVKMERGLGVGAVVVGILIFVVSGVVVFSGVLGPYLPGSSVAGGDASVLRITDWLYSPRVVGAVVLIIAAGITSWILVKAK